MFLLGNLQRAEIYYREMYELVSYFKVMRDFLFKPLSADLVFQHMYGK